MINKSKKIGVVTVTYNSANVIKDFMDSVLSQSHQNYTTYLIDNNSSDATVDILSTYQDDQVVIIVNDKNLGFSFATNQGIKIAISEGCSYVLVINNDTCFDTNLFAGLINNIQKYQCDMVAPKILYHDKPSVIWSAGGYFSKIATESGKQFGINEIDNSKYDKHRKVDFNTGCCLFINIETFAKIGLFDEKFFVYYEDSDFCLRAMRQGLLLMYIGDIKIYHKVSSLTGGESSLFSIEQGSKNRVYYIRKNSPIYLKPFYYLFCQIRYTLPFVLRKESFNVFMLRQKSFIKGFNL